MNCNDGKCNKIRKEGIVHEENICLELNKNMARAVLNFIECKSFYIFVITTAITILLVDIEIYYFTDFNLYGYHSCIADTIRGNGTINASQFTTCITDYSERSQSLLPFTIIINIISFCFILHNITLKRKLNSIDVKLNKK